METAVFLRESKDVDCKQWHKFSNRFFKEYRNTIMQYYGYESQAYYMPPKEVKYPCLFIAVMTVLLEHKIIDCNPTELIKMLYGAFSFKPAYATIHKWFYDIPPEYEEFLIKFNELLGTLKIKE